jgi:uncharacterized protein (TIGR03089 family)
MTAATLPDLLRSLLGSDPAGPLVTYYDDATGERVELSGASFENWVAKTANLLQDELSVDPGAHVALWLPTHWQTAVWVFAAASCGVTVSHTRDETPVDVVVCDAARLDDAAAAGAREVVALALRPMGQGFDEPLPAGVVDYARTVLGQGDHFLPAAAPDGEATFLRDAGWSQRVLLEQARAHAEDTGLRPRGRLLTDANPAVAGELARGPLAAMVAGGSVVLNSSPDPAALDGRVAQEQVTGQWWAHG